ncbi:MAG: FGGY family carbohydrate kinase [Bacteroidales bacterium]|nr:FGGY family carbohydrate kinase [Bacteroidales bacterium]
MNEYKEVYLAFDLGAGSWRAALGYEHGLEIRVEEIYREHHQPIERQGNLFWDAHSIFQGMKCVLKDVARRDIKLSSISIDSWSVDYALLDSGGSLLELPRCYRDKRNVGMVAKLDQRVGLDTVFKRTGVMVEDISTLCQLLAVKSQTPELLRHAATLLFIPDLMRFWLCGERATDFTMASTSQLYNIQERCWDTELLSLLGLPNHFLPRICSSGTVLGHLGPELQKETGLGRVPIVTGASHDTAAAFAAAARENDCAILSSGTWSILGVNMNTILPPGSIDFRRFGYEGNPDGSLRLVHNVPGMWFIEQCREVWKKEGVPCSYQTIIDAARACTGFQSCIDPFWKGFVHSNNIPEAVGAYCRQAGQPEPQTMGEIAGAVFMGLAKCYARALDELRKLTERPLKTLVVVGGGSQNLLLNEWISRIAGVVVHPSYIEASIIGNIINQQLAVTKSKNTKVIVLKSAEFSG